MDSRRSAALSGPKDLSMKVDIENYQGHVTASDTGKRPILSRLYRTLLCFSIAATLLLTVWVRTLKATSVPIRSFQHSAEPLRRRMEPLKLQEPATSLQDVFQVYTPVDVPASANCEVTLMQYSFANSYGHPFVGKS